MSVGVGVGGTRVAVTVGGGGANDGSIGVRSGGAVDVEAVVMFATSSARLTATGADCALLHAVAMANDMTLMQIERETEACHRSCGVLPRARTPLRYNLTLGTYSR